MGAITRTMDGLGGFVFGVIDVAYQNNLEKQDENWNPKDLEAAASDDPLDRVLDQIGVDADQRDNLRGIVRSVAQRLGDDNEIYESIDDEKSWWDRNKSKVLSAAIMVADIASVVAAGSCILTLVGCGAMAAFQVAAMGLSAYATVDTCRSAISSWQCRAGAAATSFDAASFAGSAALNAIDTPGAGGVAGAGLTIFTAPLVLWGDGVFAVDAWTSNPFAYDVPDDPL